MVIVQSLAQTLPQRYVAHPRVHLGSFAKIVVTDLPAQDEYEVRVYDTERDQRLVAAIELVSPANKDRPENRQAFIGKCAALLQNQVSVMIVDIATIRAFNLSWELLELIGQTDPLLGVNPPPVYAVTCRTTKHGNRQGGPWHFETWLQGVQVGQPLPILPLWLASDVSIPLDLETTYEETCKALRIP